MQVYWCSRCSSCCTENEWNQKYGCCKQCIPRKYRNRPTVVDGIRFDSQKEAARYQELSQLLREGKIRDLVLQPVYPLIVNGVRVASYRGDFRYVEVATGSTIVEDIKSTVTARDKVYRLKWKLVKALYHIEIIEV